MTSQFYNNNAIALSQQYLSKSFDEVHICWSNFSPAILLSKIIEKPSARILDIGAGAGRGVNRDLSPNNPSKMLAVIKWSRDGNIN